MVVLALTRWGDAAGADDASGVVDEADGRLVKVGSVETVELATVEARFLQMPG